MPVQMELDEGSDGGDARSSKAEQIKTEDGAPDSAQEEAIDENQMINEEYKIWKKNAPYLYDVVITHALDWPTLTCQWFPDREVSSSKDYTTHRILLGTHTSGQASDYLQIANIELPKREGLQGDGNLTRDQYDEERGELVAPAVPRPSPFTITQKISHEGEVNRARYMPQNPDLIATRTTAGDIWVFDRTKHPNKPDKEGDYKPNITLNGLNGDGFGLEWSENKAGHLASSSEDGIVCYWDIQSVHSTSPVHVLHGHSSCVGDVSWNPYQENVLATVGDDGLLILWDIRAGNRPAHRYQAHGDGKPAGRLEALSVAFSPSNEFLILTGGADQTIVLHDIRSTPLETPGKGPSHSNKLHTFYAHSDEVMHVTWSPHVPSVFASGSADRRVNIWDISQIGQEQTPDDAEDGVPELLFVHGGHMARIADLGWAPAVEDKWTLVSAGEDNVIMIWSPTWRIWASDEVRPRAGELERTMRRRYASDDDEEVSEDEDDEDADEEMSREGDVDADQPADTDTETGRSRTSGAPSARSSIAPSEAVSMRSARKSAHGEGMEED